MNATTGLARRAAGLLPLLLFLGCGTKERTVIVTETNPVLAAVAPGQGSTAGGTFVRVFGIRFQPGATLDFGGTAATSVTFVSAGELTAVTPAGAAGPADVTVSNPDGWDATLTGGFLYLVPPTVTGVTPSTGPSSGGTSVTVTGTGFTTGAAVSFGGSAAFNVVVSSATTLTCDTPVCAAGTVDVQVTNTDGLGAVLPGAFTFVGPPDVSSVNPAVGPTAGGTTVTITGSGFQAGAGVTFGGAAAGSVNVVSAGSITCVTPAGAAGAADVVVTNPDAQADTLAGAFTYVDPPAALAVNPTSGSAAGGTAVTVTGTGFRSGAVVDFGLTPATNVSVVSATSITCTTPAHAAGAADVVVTNPDTQSGTLPSGFTFVGGDTWLLSGTGTGGPGARESHACAWTGREMVVFGGYGGVILGDGSRYDPILNAWTALNATGAPTARRLASAVWTGREVVIWGGDTLSVQTNTGARYDPAADSWTPVTLTGAPTARTVHTAQWTGSVMLVWGGVGGAPLNTGARYDPTADSWAPLATSNAPSPRWDHVSAWTGRQMIVWGGQDTGGRLNTGGRYDPLTDSWSATALGGAPSARSTLAGVWTGSAFWVFGGTDGTTRLNSGGRYDPATDSWAPMSTAGAPAGREGHTAVWTGREMIVWGGMTAAVCAQDGGRYDGTLDAWTATNLTNAPGGRYRHSAVWTGSEMIVWGGGWLLANPPSGGWHSTGGRYTP